MSNELLPIQTYALTPKLKNTLVSNGFNKEEERKAIIHRVVSMVLDNPVLQDADPASVFNVALKMTSIGVSPETGTGYIVPYNSKSKKVGQFQLGYKGYIQLAMRTGLYKKIDCVEVKKSDYVSYDIDTNTYTWREGELTFEEVQQRKEEETIGWRAFSLSIDGHKEEMFMTMKEIEDHLNEYSRSYSSRNKQGNVHNGLSGIQMKRKTVLKLFISRHLVKTMDNNSAKSLNQALTYDEAVIDKNGKAIYIDNPNSQSNTRLKTEQKFEDVDGTKVEIKSNELGTREKVVMTTQEGTVITHQDGATSIDVSNSEEIKQVVEEGEW